MSPALLRRARPEDATLVLAMMREYYAFDRLEFDQSTAHGALEPLLADASLGEVWIAEVEGDAVGYAVLCLGWSLEFHGRDAFVDEIYLRETARGRGLGRQLLDHLVERCRAHEVRALHLEVERANRSALEVYRHAGFVDHERHLMTRPIPR